MIQHPDKKGRGRPPKVLLSPYVDFASALEYVATAAQSIRWPSARYRDDPVRFAHEILGVEPWHKQVEILEAIRDHPRVAVRSGHKIGKSNSIAIAAFWFYCSFEDARAIMTSTTSRQVDEILWREMQMIRARSGRCVACKLEDPDGRRIPAPCPHSALIDGQMGSKARTGLRSENFREISGFTAREAEAVAGISGRNLLYLPDEASGIDDMIFEAIEGNRAGGARLAMFGNPTRTEGEFFLAFHNKKDLYHCITVSSEETPNAVSGKRLIPGLAERDWIEAKKEEWGEHSAMYSVRVKGVHPLHESGKIWSIHTITQMTARHAVPAGEPDHVPYSGRLFVGLDPAGESGKGDDIVFQPRRGLRAYPARVRQGLGEDAHLVELLALLSELREPGDEKELPVVVLDREGSIGSKVYGTFRAAAERLKTFLVFGIRASDKAHRNAEVYDRQRDCLAAGLLEWTREGGCVPASDKLEAELHIWEWRHMPGSGKLKLWPPKEDVRKKHGGLGRSPDRYDALALSTWVPVSLVMEGATVPEPSEEPLTERDGPLDPYAGAAAWGRR